MKTLLILFIPVLLFGKSQEERDTIYVDDALHHCEKPDAVFFVLRKDFKRDKKLKLATWTRNLYYLSNIIAEICPVILYDDEIVPRRNGTCYSYYENGNIRKIAKYVNGYENGEYTIYHRNGKLEQKGRITKNDTYIYNDLDSNGIERMINGNASVCYYDSNMNCRSYYEIKDSLLTMSYYLDEETKDTLYGMLDSMPSFPGGVEKLILYIHENVKYPLKARFKNIAGLVIVRFVINERGEVSRAKVVRGIGGGCEEEALRVINNMPPWKPGKFQGNPVSVLYRVPVRFILR